MICANGCSYRVMDFSVTLRTGQELNGFCERCVNRIRRTCCPLLGEQIEYALALFFYWKRPQVAWLSNFLALPSSLASIIIEFYSAENQIYLLRTIDPETMQHFFSLLYRAERVSIGDWIELSSESSQKDPYKLVFDERSMEEFVSVLLTLLQKAGNGTDAYFEFPILNPSFNKRRYLEEQIRILQQKQQRKQLRMAEIKTELADKQLELLSVSDNADDRAWFAWKSHEEKRA